MRPRSRNKSDRGFGSDRSSGDVFDVRVGLQHVLDKLELHFLAGVAVFGREHLDRCALHSVKEAFVGGLDPSGAGRTGEPPDLDRRRAGRMLGGEIFAGGVAHRVEGNQRFRRDVRRIDPVDHVDDGNVLRVQFLDQIVEAVGRNGADDDRLRAVGDAVFDLRDLFVELRVAARLDEIHGDAETLRFVDHAVIDAEPVSVLHMRERHADLPRLRRLLERYVLDRRNLAVRIEGRIDGLSLVGEPVGCGARSREGKAREIAAKTANAKAFMVVSSSSGRPF